MIECTLESGHKVSFRHVTVGAITVNSNKQILLTKRANNLTNGGKYSLPGGFLDRDEDTKQATLRELKEETGLDGKIIALFQIIDRPDRPKEDRQNVQFNYLVEAQGDNFNKNDEVIECKWFSRKDLPSEDDFAFDHLRYVHRVFEYLDKPFQLPLLNY